MEKNGQSISKHKFQFVIQFFDNVEYLIDILEHGFKARYCVEKFPSVNIPLAIPMKCFCDIPLGLIKKHMSKYGKAGSRYGIGITKKFARSKGITPVIYVHQKSGILPRMVDALNNDDELAKFIPYFKRYDEKNEKTKTRYYDEREWRFVPEDSGYLNLRKLQQNKRKSKINSENRKLDKQIEKFRLKIEEKVVTFIIVENNKDVDLVIEKIMGLKKYKEKTKLRLISRIITAQRIERDF